MAHSNRFLFTNGVLSPSTDTPEIKTLLECHPGAYTTTRTHNNGSQVLFWERHLARLSNSAKILVNTKPELFLEKPEDDFVRFIKVSTQSSMWDLMVRCLVNDSMRKAMPVVSKERKNGEELAITAFVSSDMSRLSDSKCELDKKTVSEALDVYLHVGRYAPHVLGIHANAAHLAVVGKGRDVADAKYSNWVRIRKQLEKLRPPGVTELLLSNDGDQVLEGCLTNFFVVCLKDSDEDGDVVKLQGSSFASIEIQTASVRDGVLPGVVREVIVGICSKIGIPVREVAPSWSQRELWLEAFVTNSLRLLQHVETIQVPNYWESIASKTWNDVPWVEKRFEAGPGMITSIVQRALLERAGAESCPVASFKFNKC